MILKGEVRSQSLIYLNIWAAMALMEAIGKQVPPPPGPMDPTRVVRRARKGRALQPTVFFQFEKNGL